MHRLVFYSFVSLFVSGIALALQLEDRCGTLIVKDKTINQEEEIIKTTYVELMAEMITLRGDPDAKEYMDPLSGDKKIIQKERLEGISNVYRGLYKRLLDVNELMLYHTFVVQEVDGKICLNHDLVKAIAKYLSFKEPQAALWR